MMKTQKSRLLRTLSALLGAAVLLLSALPVLAAPAGGSCGASLSWSFRAETGSLTLTGSGKMDDWASAGDVPWSAYNAGILSISLPEGLTTISAWAFSATRASAVTFPASLTAIGEGAFAYSALIRAEIPAKVTSVGTGVFEGCAALTEITAAAANKTYRAAGNCLISRAEGTVVAGCRTSVLPQDGTVKAIAARAFSSVPLASVTLPASLTAIGEEAFYGTELSGVSLPAAVTSVGEGAFAACPALTSISAAAGNKTYSAAGNCLLRGSVLVCGCAASEIPASVTAIGPRAFEGCAGLTALTVPAGVTSVGERAFYNCSALSSVTLPGSLTSVGAYAFAWCESLGGIELPEQLPAVADGAFLGCGALASLTLYPALASVGDLAFTDCDALREIHWYGTAEEFAAVRVGARNEPFTGAKLVLREKPVILWGDANGDGKVDSKDLSLLRKFMAAYDYTAGTSTVEVQPGADANGDGKIDSKDLSLLRKYMAAYDYTTGTSTVVLGPSK